MRVGIGYDIHALKKGRKLILGGVEIPFERGLVGHSDGDALSHAVVDALLGAAAEGDIGEYFPDTDLRYKGASSEVFLRRTTELLHRKRLEIGYIDAVILAEAPNLSRFKEKIRKKLAERLGVALSKVSVKAKTNEGFDAVGKGLAIACHAVATLIKKS